MVNVGSMDRILRAVLGAVLLLAPFLVPAVFAPGGAWRYAAIAAGAVVLAIAIFRFCPAFLLFGIRSCARDGA